MATATSNLEILVKLRDETNAAMKGLSGKFDGLTKVAKASAIALAGVGVAVAGGLAYAVKAAADSQVQMAKVDTTLKNMGASALKNKDALLAAADAAKSLGFDDDDAAVSITNFYQRTGNLTEATKLNALAMDLARAKSIDLATASGLVGQVLSGNGRVLKQYDIELSDSLSPLQALGVMHEKIGGQAENAAKTFAIQMQILKLEFDDFVKAIGNKILPILNDLAQKYLPVVVDALGRLSNYITTVGNTLAEHLPSWSAFKGWVDAVKTSVTDFIDLTAPLWDIFKKSLDDLWVTIRFNLWPAIKDLFVALEPLVPIIGVALYLAIITITKVLTFLITLLAEIIKGWTGIFELLTSFGKSALDGARKDWDMLTGALNAVISALKTVYEWGQKAYNTAKSALGLSGSGKSSSKKVDDAVISPSGSIVSTHPQDWLIATQNPLALAGVGGNVTIQIGSLYGTDRNAAEQFANQIARMIKMNIRI